METPNNNHKRTTTQAELKQPSARAKKQNTGSLVDSLLSDLDQEAPKKTDKNEELRQKHIDDLTNIFSEAYVIASKGTQMPTQTEIEARFGVYSTTGFKSGIKKNEFEFLVNILRGKQENVATTVKELDYIYESPFPELPGKLRMTINEETNQMLRATIKNRSRNHLLKFSGLPYDCRVSISTEVEVPLPPQGLPPNFEIKRKKFRWSFEGNGGKSPWRIDLTQVITEVDRQLSPDDDDLSRQVKPPNLIQSSTYEIEFEIKATALSTLNNPEHMRDTVQEFYALITQTLTFLQQMRVEQFPEVGFVNVTDESKCAQLRQTIRQIFKVSDNNDDEFPGSMPVTFSRRYFPIVQTKPYFVSEKTDGIRYLMLIVSDGIYFIDRKYQIRSVRFDLLNELYGTKGPTLLDGEMVRHAQTQRPIFMVFDVIMINNQYVADKNLSSRLQIIGTDVIAPYRQITKNQFPSSHPFGLIGKTFFPKDQIKKLFAHIRKDERTGQRFYVDDIRCHRTDGIIFTPDESYHVKTTFNLFKWKYVEKLSVDFKLTRVNNSNEFILSAQADGREVACKSVTFLDNDRTQLLNDMSNHTNLKSYIIECSYDPWIGYWRYQGIRTDKNKPNALSVIFDVMECISENITKEELIYRLQLSPEKDNWQVQIQTLCKSLAEGGSISSQVQHPTKHALSPQVTATSFHSTPTVSQGNVSLLFPPQSQLK
jgi:mRNA guanylyltransferase